MKVYSINLVYYTEENVPECGKTIFVLSNKDLTKLPTHLLKENIDIVEAIEANCCEDIGSIDEITMEEFREFYPDEELIEI